MFLDKKWAKIVALALSLPSTIFVMGLFFKMLVDGGILSKTVSVILFLLVILNTLFLIVYYAMKKRSRDEDDKEN